MTSSTSRADLSPSYPPEHHILRDLGIFVALQGLEARAGLEIVPELRSSSGGVRAGVIAMLVDVVAGAYATRAVAPGWVATCDLVVHALHDVTSGSLVAQPRLLRHGSSTVVVEVEVTAASSPDELVALGTATFSILESRGADQRTEPVAELVRTEFALPGSGLSKPVLDAIGAQVREASKGFVELAMSPYVGNTLKALQGGVLALLIDRAAEVAGRHAGRADWQTKDLVIHYLALGKVGPIRTSARLLQRSPHGARLRVEVFDEGREARLLSVATVEVGPRD